MAWQRFFFGEPLATETLIRMEGPEGALEVVANFISGTGLLTKITVTNTAGGSHEVILRRSGGVVWKSDIVLPSQALEHLPVLPVTFLADIEGITARMI